MAKRDYYEVLGLKRDASADDIKKAYRSLCRTEHPDVAPPDKRPQAEERFREINEAYSVLSDPDRRGRYDQFGHDAERAGAGAQDFGDLFGGFGGLGDLFSAFFDMGGGGRAANRPQRGPDIRELLELTLEEAFSGVQREVKIQRAETCPTCDGRRSKPGTNPKSCSNCRGSGVVQAVVRTPFGQMMRQAACAACQGEGRVIRDPCQECQGRGRVLKDKKIDVNVPKGVDTGQWIRVPAMGHAGTLGGPPGDLHLVITLKPHASITRDGDDLFMTKRITFTDAALGAEVTIDTLEGSSKLKIPAGTQSGSVFKIKDKGMPILQGYGRGSLHVEIQVMTPTRLNDKQKKLLKEFANAGSQEAEEQKGFFKRVLDAILG